jgi:hypothetical protein
MLFSKGGYIQPLLPQKKAGAKISEIFRQPGCLLETQGFPPHPREWFSIIAYH